MHRSDLEKESAQFGLSRALQPSPDLKNSVFGAKCPRHGDSAEVIPEGAARGVDEVDAPTPMDVGEAPPNVAAEDNDKGDGGGETKGDGNVAPSVPRTPSAQLGDILRGMATTPEQEEALRNIFATAEPMAVVLPEQKEANATLP